MDNSSLFRYIGTSELRMLMGRLLLRDQEVQNLITQILVPAFLQFGSVNALTRALNEVLAEKQVSGRIYPNRIHALLSDELDRAINEETARLIQSAENILSTISANGSSPNVIEQQILACWQENQAREDGDQQVSKVLRIPLAVVRYVLEKFREIKKTSNGRNSSAISIETANVEVKSQPDWSFQDDAVQLCLQALKGHPNKKVGVIIPTGGGKTRTALRIVLRWLVSHPDGNVIWLTHRKNLRDQARTELQLMLSASIPDIPEDATELLVKRIEFLMMSNLEKRLESSINSPSLIVVDEAHHAAAPTYQSIFETPYALNGLFLTATPNRTDELPIGIDEIAYSITFGELERRGAIIRPKFEEFPIEDFDWSFTAVSDLANCIIERSATDFTKVLVLAPRVERVTEFYDALQEELLNYSGHPLTEDDIGYIHGGGNSRSTSNEEFLEHFRAKPRGIYVSAQLLLEGFNDPGINAVIITYPCNSLIQLMQAVGRCVRYLPEKRNAFVVQARNDALSYYFDQRWLYQEISDELRPQLVDIDYSDHSSLIEKAITELRNHKVSEPVIQKIQEEITNITPGATCRLMLTGTPYFGNSRQFETDATWNAILESSYNSLQLRWIFNDFCARGASTSEPSGFLRQYGQKFGFHESFELASLWRQYSNLLTAMYQAKEEIYGNGAKSAHGTNRPFRVNGATTWLKYITFRYVPSISPEFSEFLSDCYNSDTITSIYSEQPSHYSVVIKLPLPVGANEAHLLCQNDWLVFDECLSRLREVLQSTPNTKRFSIYEAELTELTFTIKLPLSVIKRLEYFLRVEEAHCRIFHL